MTALRLLGAAVAALALACTGANEQTPADTPHGGPDRDVAAAGPQRVTTIEGFQTPESAIHDAEQDVWFVSNIAGNPNAADGNGFISRLRSDGTVDSLHFVAGGRSGVTLNGPKGMALVGDTLWVSDIDVVRAFDRRSGTPLRSVSLKSQGAVFLNDVVAGPDGIYVTDTGIRFDADGAMSHPGPDRIFRIAGGTVTEAIRDPAVIAPNGIEWDESSGRMIVVSFSDSAIVSFAPGSKDVTPFAIGATGADGIARMNDGRFLVSTWQDSSIYVMHEGNKTRLIRGVPSPADIGLDARRNRVAIPLFTKNRVEIWQVQ